MSSATTGHELLITFAGHGAKLQPRLSKLGEQRITDSEEVKKNNKEWK